MGSSVGNVDALKALCVGGLRQISVPAGAERLKGLIVVVVPFVIVAAVVSAKNRREDGWKYIFGDSQ